MNRVFDMGQLAARTHEIRDIPRMAVGEAIVIERPTIGLRSRCQSVATRTARKHGMVVTTKRLDWGVRVERLA